MNASERSLLERALSIASWRLVHREQLEAVLREALAHVLRARGATRRDRYLEQLLEGALSIASRPCIHRGRLKLVLRAALARMPSERPARDAPGLEPFRKPAIAAAPAKPCAQPRGSLYNRKRGIVYRLGCGRWSCRACARRKAAVLGRRFERIRWRGAPALVTLTAARVEDADPTPEAMRRFSRRVASFRRWVKRHYGAFQWAWVREIAPRQPWCVCHEMRACRCGAGGGRLHVHMVWDAAYVPQARLSRAAVRSGLGSVMDVRRVNGARAARYVSKYLAKDGAQHPAFRHARRFALRAAEPEPEPSEWSYDSRCPAQVAVERLGCHEIDWDAEGWCAWTPTAQAGAGGTLPGARSVGSLSGARPKKRKIMVFLESKGDRLIRFAAQEIPQSMR